jgi:TRAP-type C4-dicarboxylate transport system permease small subunit
MPEFEQLGGAEPEYRLVAPLSRAADVVLGGVAAALLFVMMSVTFVDVTGRYVFNSPLPGGYELTQLLMLSLVFAGLPTVTRRGDHITVGLFDNAFRGWVRALRDTTIWLVVAIAAAYLAWRLYLLGGRFSLFGDTTATLRIPLAPIAYAGAGAMLLAALSAFIRLAEAWTIGRQEPRR